MPYRTFLAVLVAFALSTADVRAQSPLAADAWLVSAGVGIAFDPDADVSPAIAGAAAFPITSSVALEGELGHLFDLASDDPDVDSSLTTVHGSVLYFVDTPYVLAPYIAAGFGVGHFSHEVIAPPASLSRTEIGFNLGGGVTYPMNDWGWVRGDFRFVKHIDDVPSAWRLLAALTLRVGG